MRRTLALLAFAAAVLLVPSEAHAAVAAQGEISQESGTSYRLAVNNTGDETIQCLRFTAADGVTMTDVQGGGTVTLAPDGRSFAVQNAALASAATTTYVLTTTGPYPVNGGGQLNVSSDCVADVAAPVSGPPPPPAPGPQQQQPQPGPQPVVGTTEVASVVSGTVLVRTPGTKRFRRLSGTEALPDGTEVDATNGTVHLTLAQPGGGTESADVSEGRFVIDQDTGTPAVTTLKLSEPLAGCSRRAAAAAKPRRKKAKKKRRQIFVSTQGGHVRTQGRYAAAIATGTAWRTLDRCTSTTIQVAQGTVRVTDLRRRTSAPLTAPRRRVVRRR